MPRAVDTPVDNRRKERSRKMMVVDFTWEVMVLMYQEYETKGDERGRFKSFGG